MKFQKKKKQLEQDNDINDGDDGDDDLMFDDATCWESQGPAPSSPTLQLSSAKFYHENMRGLVLMMRMRMIVIACVDDT